MPTHLLNLAQSSVCIIDNIIIEIEKYDTEINFIHEGMTGIVKPLDFGIF